MSDVENHDNVHLANYVNQNECVLDDTYSEEVDQQNSARPFVREITSLIANDVISFDMKLGYPSYGGGCAYSAGCQRRPDFPYVSINSLGGSFFRIFGTRNKGDNGIFLQCQHSYSNECSCNLWIPSTCDPLVLDPKNAAVNIGIQRKTLCLSLHSAGCPDFSATAVSPTKFLSMDRVLPFTGDEHALMKIQVDWQYILFSVSSSSFVSAHYTEARKQFMSIVSIATLHLTRASC